MSSFIRLPACFRLRAWPRTVSEKGTVPVFLASFAKRTVPDRCRIGSSLQCSIPPLCFTWLPPMILLIDNYDSFTYNLVQRLGEIDPDLDLLVKRNDEITLDELAELAPSHLIVSPGPCTPSEAGISCAGHFPLCRPIADSGRVPGHRSIGQAAVARSCGRSG